MSSALKRAGAVVVVLTAVVSVGRLLRASVPQVPSNTWAATGEMAQARAGASSVLLYDGHVLVTGGLDATGASTATAERYAPDGGTFLSTPPMAFQRANHTSTLLSDGRVLVVGGVDAGGAPIADAELFDPALGAEGDFVPTSALDTPRAGHALVPLCDGTFLVVGGASGAEIYNPL